MQIDAQEHRQPGGRGPREKPGAMLALLLAVVAGGLIAFGLVQLVPDSWRINIGGKGATSAGGRKQANRPARNKASGDNAATPSIEAGSLNRTGRDVPEQKRTPPDTPEERAATQLLDEAKALLAAGKRDQAIPLLEKTYSAYPGTAAAVEALKLVSGD